MVESDVEQLQFGFRREWRVSPGRSPRTASRLYFALLPDPAAADAALRLARQLRLPGRLQPAHLLHVSLYDLGHAAGLSPLYLDWFHAAADAVSLPRFEISFDRILNFGNGPRPHLVLASQAGAGQIADLVWQLTHGPAVAMDEAARQPRITPHMTLVYKGHRIDEQFLAEPVRWTVREFVLVQSFYGEGRHEYLGRWPLGATNFAERTRAASLPRQDSLALEL